MVRRPTSRFLPPPPPPEKVSGLVSRDFARIKRKKAGTPELGRKRKIAGDLPGWDPLPPGEAPVVRPVSRR